MSVLLDGVSGLCKGSTAGANSPPAPRVFTADNLALKTLLLGALLTLRDSRCVDVRGVFVEDKEVFREHTS